MAAAYASAMIGSKRAILADPGLNDRSTAFSMKQNLLNTWDDTLMIDPLIFNKVKGKDKTRLKEYSNPRFWMKAAAFPESQKKFRYHKEVLKDLQLKYDDCAHTLIKEQSDDELVSVLAHEVGHYKMKHIQTSMIIGVLQMGLILFILSIFINKPELSQALGWKKRSCSF